MKVTLISHTPDAETLLLFTKATRLTLSPGLLEEMRTWSVERKAQEIALMAKTIKSSWEFVDVVFLVEDVSRACAQQMTRTRAASYAMQSQRVTDVRAVKVHAPQFASDSHAAMYAAATAASLASYAQLVDAGLPLEDARGVLPMNTTCNLIAKYNLRAFCDLAKTRASLRAQGEYSAVAREMRSLVIQTWPWAAPFFESEHELAIRMLEDAARQIGVKTGSGPGWDVAKAIDLLRKA